MRYITIDGDDIGQKIASAYLTNDAKELTRTNNLVQDKITKISNLLGAQGFTILFCAADGVAGMCSSNFDNSRIFSEIRKIAGDEISFSAGVGRSLRDAYIALLFAKSSGKSRLQDFDDMN